MVVDLSDYGFVVDLDPVDGDYDAQGHLNNAAVVKLFERARIKYQNEGLGGWRQYLTGEHVVAVRELRVRYESEGFPGERYRAGTRIVSRRQRSYTFDQVLVDVESGRVIATADVVMVFVDRVAGRAVPIPDAMWTLVEQREGRSMPAEVRNEP